ncbi:hypothetical protein [Draconibacterium sediminis]|uniref:Uncharacterized protein n=1 Tax=Draconibacterium sediminis TaxID=1544798 RepID=A0A0D8JAY5_9BACT|nr:hypothetical protein [Draconibacterium sediminis]KJF44160.1 hypothetical protein LH29_01125 [Draconibacterium sediminis]
MRKLRILLILLILSSGAFGQRAFNQSVVVSGSTETTDHSSLSNLSFDKSGHTGFAGLDTSNTFTKNQFVPYTIYGASWNRNNSVPTMAALYEKIELLDGSSDSYIKNIVLTGNSLNFTGVDSAFNSMVGNIANLSVANVFTQDISVPTETYGSSWNGNNSVPTKNALYDKIENLTLNMSSGTVTSITAGNGMDFSSITTSGLVTLGTPSTITSTSVNSVTTASHSHQIDLTGLTITESQISDLQSYLTEEIDNSITNEIQTIDVFQLNGTDLELSLENDGEAKKIVDLSGLSGDSSLWTEDTYGIDYNNTGNVGIGQNSLEYTQLIIKGDNTETGLYVSSSSGTGLWVSSSGVAEAGLFFATDTYGTGVSANGGARDFIATGSGLWQTKERTSSPSTPLTEYGAFYGKDDGKFYYMNDSGTEYDLTDGGGTVNYGASTEIPLTNTTVDGFIYNSGFKLHATGTLYVPHTVRVKDAYAIENEWGSSEFGAGVSGLWVHTSGDLMFTDNTDVDHNLLATGSTWNYGVQIVTTAWNVDNGLNATITLSANTSIAFSNLEAGMTGNLTVSNAATAYTITFTGYTVVIAPYLDFTGDAITMSGNSTIDILSWYYDGTRIIVNGTLDYQ